MSTNRSWRASLHCYNEEAIAVVMRCVAALRQRGMKTEAATHELAKRLQVSPRRVHTLFFRDGTPRVLVNEWANIRYRAGLFFLNEAARHREIADRYDAEADALLNDQLEFNWVATWDENVCSRARTAGGRR